METRSKTASIGITGTSKGASYEQIKTCALLLRNFSEYARTSLGLPSELHHGDCIGADSAIAALAQELGFRLVAHPPQNPSKQQTIVSSDEYRPPDEYLLRNRDIVNESERLIALPHGPEEKRSGTWSTVRYARKRKIPITIVWPDGTVSYEHKL